MSIYCDKITFETLTNGETKESHVIKVDTVFDSVDWAKAKCTCILKEYCKKNGIIWPVDKVPEIMFESYGLKAYFKLFIHWLKGHVKRKN